MAPSGAKRRGEGYQMGLQFSHTQQSADIEDRQPFQSIPETLGPTRLLPDVATPHNVTMPEMPSCSPLRPLNVDNDKIQKHMFKLADMDKVLKKQMRSLTKSCLPSPASAMVAIPTYPDGVELEPRSAKSWKMHAVLGKPRGRGNTVQKHATEMKKRQLVE